MNMLNDHFSRLAKLLVLAGVCTAVTGLNAMAAGGRQTLQTHVPAATAAVLQPIGDVPGSTVLHLSIGLPLRDQAGLDSFLQDIYNPASANYHRYVSVAQFTERFGPSQRDYDAVTAFAASHNLTVTATHPNRMILDVTGTVADINQAFQMTVRNYQHPTEARTFFAPDVAPTVDSGIPILAVGGLDNFILPRPMDHRHKPGAVPYVGTGPFGSYMGNDFRAAYVPGTPLAGRGQKVALFELDGYFPSDIAAYEVQANLPAVNVVPVLVDGFNGAPVDPDGNSEVSLDIEMVIAMAPGVDSVLVYEGSPFFVPANDILNRMATDNAAQQISSSWGFQVDLATTQIFQEYAAQGQTYFNAAGDSGAYTAATGGIFPPSDNPFITSVGGTTLETTTAGGAWMSETVWSWYTSGEGPAAGSGGISTVFPIPGYQQGVGMANNGGSTTSRNIPDVALTADNIYVIADDGVPEPGTGGTSAAAPLWAGFIALVNEQAQQNGEPSVGFINPAVYAIGLGASYNLGFHDITTGNNTNLISTNFFAVTGYDLCTGWGSPSGTNLINMLAPISPIPRPFPIVLTNTIYGGNGNGIIDVDECNSMDIVLGNIGKTNATDIESTLSSPTAGVFITQPNSQYLFLPSGGMVTNLTPFKVSTTPTFVCGTPITLILVVKCDQVTTTNQFTVTTGGTGIPRTFNNQSPVRIPENSSLGTNSSIIVRNVDSVLNHLTVSVNISQQFVGDLYLQLIGPDGTSVILSAFNGGLGSNYGLECVPGEETTFDDASTNSIDQGLAPFVGTYQPDEPLSAFVGKVGTAVNGVWQLQVIDFGNDAPGELECWSLAITPAGCEDGGGQCPGTDLAVGLTASPNSVVLGNNLTYTINVTNFGPNIAAETGVSQILPPTVQFVSATSSQGSCSVSSNTVSCNFGNLGVGSNAVATVIVFPLSAGLISSTATALSLQPDFNPANNVATLISVVEPPSCDMAVGLTANPNPVLLGGVLNYTIVVTNNGPSAASGVWVTNTLPSGAGLISAGSPQGVCTSVGNTVLCNLGSMASGAVATVNIAAGPTVLGNITDTVKVSALQSDPRPGNNTASVTTAVTPAADLSLTMTASPAAVIVGSNIVYTINVVNLGSSQASGVVINDTLPFGLTNVTAVCPNGVCAVVPGAVSCALSNTLAAGSSTVLTITVNTKPLTGQIPSNGKSPLTLVNTASVLATQADPNLANDSASVSTVVNVPIVNVVAAGTLLAAESFTPTNGMVDPGETVKVYFGLQNAGNITSTNPVVATLLATGGVITNSGSIINYGLMTNGAAAIFQPLTFKSSAAYGGTVTASLQLSGGATNLVKFVFNIPQTNGFANTGNIVIPDHGAATPYASVINVSGLAGVIGRVSVTLTNVNHTYPDDVDMLLVGPQGQNVLLESHAGGGGVLTNVSLTFDQGATNSLGLPNFLPASSQILSGVYMPSQFESDTVTNLPAPAPAAPYGTSLSVFDGSSPNGAWSLYVFDSSPGDAGIIVGGWSLAIESGNTVNPVADLAITGTTDSNPVLVGDNLTYTFIVTNNGPSAAQANTVVFTDVLSPFVSFVSAVSSQGVFTNIGGTVYCTVTNSLPLGTNVVISLVVAPTGGAISALITNQASVGLTVGADDPNQSNNSTTLLTTGVAPTANLTVSLSGSLTNVVIGSSNLVYTITVTNNGPGAALNVTLSDALGGMTLLSTVSLPSLGSPSVTNGIASWNLGGLAAGTGVAAFLTVAPTAVGIVTNVATAGTLSIDSNLADNTAAFVATVNALAPNIIPAGASLVSGGNAFGAIAPGQTVTVSLALTNNGTASTVDLQAALAATAGVTPVTTGAVDYGALTPGGATVANQFTFTASGANAGVITATLQLTDQGIPVGAATFHFNLPATNSYSSAGPIIIPDHGPATPYPSVITVSGVNGLVSQATVTLTGFAHQFPNDVQTLLVGPSGNSIVLMGGVGGPNLVTNVTLTFDDSASNTLPSFYNGAIVSGTYKPTDFSLAQAFVSPAPAGPYGATLASFEGSNPNGVWSLYILDNSPGDSGQVAGGWSLSLTSMDPVNSATDLGVSQTVSAPPVYAGTNFTINIGVTNKGPAKATDLTITDVLPSGLTLVTNSTGLAPISVGDSFAFNVGGLDAGAGVNLILTVTGSAGIYTNSVVVSADQADFNPGDNSTSLAFVIYNSPVSTLGGAAYSNGSFTLTLSGQTGLTYVIQSSTNLTTWTPISTNTLSSPTFQFTDANAGNYPYQYYRAVLQN